MTKEQLKMLPNMTFKDACRLLGVDHNLVIVRYLDCDDCPLDTVENCDGGCIVAIEKLFGGDKNDCR